MKYRIPLAALPSDQDIWGKYNKQLQSKNQETVKGRLIATSPRGVELLLP